MVKEKKKTLPVKIISDNPESDLRTVSFGFDAYTRTIAGLIANKENETPLVIGIYGPWGSGKTTLMKTVQSSLGSDEYTDANIYRKCKSVWFQAWKFNNENEILAALIEEIFKTMAADNFFEECKALIEKLTKRLDYSKVVGNISKIVTGTDITEIFSELEYKDKLGFYETFQKYFDDLLWTYLSWRAKVTDSEKPDDKTAALVVFIDDLDRCPRPRILKVLETIKLFMDRQGCIFVIGAANDIIEQALQGRYGADAVAFMDKIVQVTFNLPHISDTGFESFIEHISPDFKEDMIAHLPLILPAVKNNPRQFKRFINNMSLQEDLFRERKIEVAFKHIFFWNIIDYSYPSLREELKENPNILAELQKAIKDLNEITAKNDRWEFSDEVFQEKNIPNSFYGYLRNKTLVNIIKAFDVDRETLEQLITLSGIVESAVDARDKAGSEKDFQYKSDNMVKIPAGEFLYGENKDNKTIEYDFYMDVYPVTNSQYKKFIDEGGYEKDTFWSSAGLQWRKTAGVTRPRHWAERSGLPDHPVVGVSYYEAQAYAAWAGKRLPTEEEWEKAARGKEGFEYPWENGFDKEKCNSRESGIEGTTPVTRYPNGRSPYGCYDMAGNVWEWTSSFYDEDKDRRVLRGGSWGGGSSGCRCAIRGRIDPLGRGISMGFRCARTLNL